MISCPRLLSSDSIVTELGTRCSGKSSCLFLGVCDAMAHTRNSALMLRQLKYRLLGGVTVGVFWIVRRIDRKRMANFLGGLMRIVGPWLPEHRIGRANLAAAFPDKSPAEIATILTGVWDNLGGPWPSTRTSTASRSMTRRSCNRETKATSSWIKPAMCA